MKDSLFALLMNFFEQTLAQLDDSKRKTAHEHFDNALLKKANNTLLLVRHAQPKSTRILTELERCKLTKTSYQFLMKLSLCNFLSPFQIDAIIQKASLSDSRFVAVEEIKWIIRSTLVHNLDDLQVAFLDLVLYQKEDRLVMH